MVKKPRFISDETESMTYPELVSFLRSTLNHVVSVAAGNPEPIHFKVKEAIERAKVVLADTEEAEDETD